jgi:hypothetical protein
MKTPQVDALPGVTPLGLMKQPVRVALTTIDQLEISTVDLGDFHLGHGKAYETCVFYPNGNSSVKCRSSTLAEALEWHAKIVLHEVSHLNQKAKVQDDDGFVCEFL